MRYLALLYSDETVEATEQDWADTMAAYTAFGEAAGAAGVIAGGDALQPTSTATTVRVRNGETLTTDGPFAETKEQLGGYYMLTCADLDDAIKWASQIPGASMGCVEVRPVIEFD
ncbi:MAG: YciI family protein [Acidimicrobiales bacterium]